MFDFDGLILDTETPELDAWTAIFREHGAEMPPGYWANTVGRGADQISENPTQLLERLTGLKLDHSALRAQYQEMRMERILRAQPLPGVVDLLGECRAAGVSCAVVSSSRHPWVDGHLSRLGLSEWFVTTVCAGDAPQAKPFPDLYLEALRRLGVSAPEAIALEDSSNGARAAVDAGIFVVVVPNPVTEGFDFSHANALLRSLDGVTLGNLEDLREPIDSTSCKLG